MCGAAIMTGWWTAISNRYRRERQFLKQMPSFWRFLRAAKYLAVMVLLLAITRYDGTWPAFLLTSTNWRDVLVSVEKAPRVTIVSHELFRLANSPHDAAVRVRAVLANTTNHPVWLYVRRPRSTWEWLTAKGELGSESCGFGAPPAMLKPGRAIWFEDTISVKADTKHIDLSAWTFWIDGGTEYLLRSRSQKLPIDLSQAKVISPPTGEPKVISISYY